MTTTIHRKRKESAGRSLLRNNCVIFLFSAALAIALLFGKDANAVRSPSSYPGRKNRNGIRSNNSFRNTATISTATNIHHTNENENENENDDDIQREGGNHHNTASVLPRGGASLAKKATSKPPPIYWAILHNWLYFMSLGFNLVNVPFMIREIVDGPGSKLPTRQSIKLGGNVEAIDKILTFCGVAFLAALSDKHGRKPLIAWSSFGFAATNLLQAFAGMAPTLQASKALLYVADFVDGISSCMSPVCQAYVADCSVGSSSSLASNIGVFQGISIGGAFVFAFPIGGLLGAKFGPQLPILLAAGFQLINGLLALFVTPESNARVVAEASKPSKRPGARKTTGASSSSSSSSNSINLAEVNPITGLRKLFGIGLTTPGFGTSSVSLLRTASLTYFFLSLARGSLDAQFVNYSNIKFGWTQAQSGPVLVMIGLMLAIVPRILVPLLGLRKCIHYGLLIYAVGLSSSGMVATQAQFVLSLALVAVGCVATPALQALLANLASPSQTGALLGAIGSMNELTGAIGSTLFAAVLATFAMDATPQSSSTIASLAKSVLPDIQGMHFVLGAWFALIGWGISSRGLKKNQDHPALAMAVDKSVLSAAAMD